MWSFSSAFALSLNYSHFNRFEKDNYSSALRSVVVTHSNNNTFFNCSMRNSINEAAYIIDSSFNWFEANDMSANTKMLSRKQAVLIAKSDDTNWFLDNNMCHNRAGMFCQMGLPIDLGGNLCLSQTDCNLTCGNCTEDKE